jgi:hypothetical protein
MGGTRAGAYGTGRHHAGRVNAWGPRSIHGAVREL